MKLVDEECVFDCTGRRASGANCSIIGLKIEQGPTDSAWWRIKGGYDNQITAPWDDSATDNEETALTADEMRELADFMIQQWTTFRDGLPKETDRAPLR